MVIADTSVWIDYLSKKKSALGDVVSQLIADRSLALAGLVLAELIRGTRGDRERSELEEELSSARYIEMTGGAWRRAGLLSSHLDSKGQPLPMSDIIVAALAIENGHELFTRDKHFKRIPDLRLYDWKDPSNA